MTSMVRQLGAVLVALALTLVIAPAYAQQFVEDMEARQAESERDLEDILREREISQERLTEIAEEIEAVRNDQASLSAALIQVAKTERKLALDIDQISATLGDLRGREGDLRGSLAQRRGLLAEVLGALQRIGLNPPPAILVTPEDALSSVRSSILLSAIVPELREETEILLGDLQELSRIATSIEAQRRTLQTTVSEQLEERERLSLLLEQKEQLQARSEEEEAEQRRRIEELAADAESLQELIESMETEIAAARREAERERELAQQRREEAETGPSAGVSGGLRQSAAFAELRGALDLPARGHIARHFGDDDAAGRAMMGDIVATQSGAIVTSPMDAAVLYAGTFRSYGQLLILDAGDGYHIVLAGMGRISVSPGQVVLAGEPVGMMGETRVASAVAFGNVSAGPELYVEFREDGRPVDPAPWWAEHVSGRTENDS